MDLKHLREVAKQNRGKVKEDARQKRELEFQRHQAELKKKEEEQAGTQQRIESKKTEIRRQVEEAASQGHRKVAIGNSIHFMHLIGSNGITLFICSLDVYPFSRKRLTASGRL